MQTRRLWRRAAALAGGAVVGFLCISTLRRTPDEPRARRLQEWDGEKSRPDGTGVRPLRCFQGYQQIQGGGHSASAEAWAVSWKLESRTLKEDSEERLETQILCLLSAVVRYDMNLSRSATTDRRARIKLARRGV